MSESPEGQHWGGGIYAGHLILTGVYALAEAKHIPAAQQKL